MFKFKPKFQVQPEAPDNEEITMSAETTGDFVQEQLTGDDITANYELLRAAGLIQDPFAFLSRAKNSSRCMQDLTRAVDALAKDVSERMVSAGSPRGPADTKIS